MPLLMQTDHKQTCTDTSSFNVPGVHCKWLRVTCSYIIRLISFCGLASFFCDANLMWRYFERTITQISWFELITHDAMMCQVELHRSTSDQLWHSHTSQVLFFFFLFFNFQCKSLFCFLMLMHAWQHLVYKQVDKSHLISLAIGMRQNEHSGKIHASWM